MYPQHLTQDNSLSLSPRTISVPGKECRRRSVLLVGPCRRKLFAPVMAPKVATPPIVLRYSEKPPSKRLVIRTTLSSVWGHETPRGILMSRSYNLSSVHYASKWAVPADDEFHDRDAVNLLAIRYANLPDGPEKEGLFLTLVQCFHGILIKYTNMVIRGQLPSLRSRPGKDAANMLRNLLKPGETDDMATIPEACRSLHLAFKQLSTDEVYDVMVMCFLRACHHYDPKYTDKVRQVCEVVDAKFGNKQFTAEVISAELDFDAVRCVRLLVSKGYLVAVYGPRRKVLGYKRGPEWPPKPAFFKSGPIGFVYHAQRQFRFYLIEFIKARRNELEARPGLLQLDYRPSGVAEAAAGDTRIYATALPSADGNFSDANGVLWAADTDLMHSQVDISRMTDAWVKSTDDRLFRTLTPQERWILQMVDCKEYNWVQVAALLQCSTQTARQQYNEVMQYLPGHVVISVKAA